MPENEAPLFLDLDDESIVYAVNSPLILEASAGSGKTTMLVERYIASLFYLMGFAGMKARDAVRAIVAITFTNKAAAEIKDKIRKKLGQCITPEYLGELFIRLARHNPGVRPGPVDAIIAQEEALMSALNDAPVSTIHSYGLGLLHNHPVEAGLDPLMKISSFAGNQNNLPLANEATHATVMKMMREKNPGFARLVSLVGINETMKFIGEVRDLCDDIGFAEFGRKLASAGYMEYEKTIAGMSEADLGQFIDGKIRPRLAEIQGAIDGYCAYKKKDLPSKDFMPLLRKLPHIDPSRLDQVSGLRYKEPPPVKDETIIGFRNAVRRATQAIATTVHQLIFPLLLPVLRELYDTYSRLKIERLELLFSDIETSLDDALRKGPALADCVRGDVRYFLIDEYQDTSDIQKRIFDAILSGAGAGKSPIVPFIVGDPKQSIYRFRYANVDVFDDTSREFIARYGKGAKKYLSKNYRSTERIIDNVNTVFGRVFSTHEADEIVYKDQSAGKPGKPVDGTDYYFIPAQKSEGRSLKAAKENNYTAAANIINALVISGEYKPRDIMIILRVKATPLKTILPIFDEYLAPDIPFVFADKRNMIEDTVINDIVIYLKALDRPESDYYFAALLKTPFFRFTDSRLLELSQRARETKRSFYAALSDEQFPEMEFFKSLARMKSKLDIATLVRKIVDDTGYLTYLYSLPESKTAVTGALMFLNFIESIKSGEVYNLTQFIYYLQTNKPELQFPQLFGDICDVVRIMSAHGVKGLESRAVIYIATPGKNLKPKIYIESREGLPPIGFALTGADLNYERLDQWNDKKTADEERRLAYVAMTRAREKFFYIGVCDTEKVTQDGWSGFIRSDDSFFAGKIFDMETLPKEGKNKLSVSPTVEGADEWARMLMRDFAPKPAPLLPAAVTVTQLLDMEFSPGGFNKRYIIKSYPISEMIGDLDDPAELLSLTASRAEIGTFLHNVFRYAGPGDYEGYIDTTLPIWDVDLSANRDELVRLSGLFFRSEMYEKYYRENSFRRNEWEFNFPLAHKLYTPLLKGSVDCYIVRDGLGILIDYKLKLSGDMRYPRQVNYYAYVLRKIGHPVDKLFLYEIETGKVKEAELEPLFMESLVRDNLNKIVDEFIKAGRQSNP
ncbi:MAG: UvrD-helicase domain-containing protein [Brevinematales bacterium]|nr:UvrD-helicase domain-containing protein [Brevinematales bacterium]